LEKEFMEHRATLRVAATDLDGQPLGEVELALSVDGHLTVNGQTVVAMRPLGSRVVLVVVSRQYCVASAEYWRVLGAARGIVARGEAAQAGSA
jgi:hypothetical protein